MNYVIFNADGSLAEQSLEYYIQQGSSGDKIFVGFSGALNTDVTIALAVLPNGSSNTIAGVFQSAFAYKTGATADGWLFTLTNAQTLYNGIVKLAIRISRGSDILVSYPIALVINETGVIPSADSGVTIEELNEFLVMLQNYATVVQVDGKVDKVSTPTIVYGTDSSGLQTTIGYAANASTGKLVQRLPGGQIEVPTTPTDNSHATSKSYVDTGLSGKVDKTSSANKIYITDDSGSQTTSGYDDYVDGDFVRRNSDNQIYVPATPTASTHASSKSYVDNAIASAVSSAYIYKGTKTVSEINSLNTSTLTAGWVYNVSDSGTIILGSISVSAGDNIAWTGSGWDKLSTTVDLTPYVTKTTTIAGIDLSGNISAQSLTDALVFMDNTDDLDYVMGE